MKCYSIGDITTDDDGMNIFWDGKSWVYPTKKERIVDGLNFEKVEDVIDTIITILIKNQIIKNIDEFKEMLESNKLANTLSEE